MSEPLSPREVYARRQLLEADALPDPTADERAETLERLAARFASEGELDWTGFLTEVSAWVPDPLDLKAAKVLPDDEGHLRAAEPGPGEPQLFLPPIIGEERDAVRDVPISLRSRIAFLSQELQIRPDDQPTHLTPLGEWLRRIMVAYDPEAILSKVLEPALPARATALSPGEELRCQDILRWGVLLVKRAKSRDTLLPLLADLRVPCRGGWFTLRDAVAGQSWTKLGDLLVEVLTQLDTAEATAVLDRTLLPKGHPAWCEADLYVAEVFDELGVADGLHPMAAPTAWACRIPKQAGRPVELGEPPAGLGAGPWSGYASRLAEALEPHRLNARPDYQLSNLMVLPGWDEVCNQPPNVRQRFTEMVVRSLPHWSDRWKVAVCQKVKGGNRYQVPSPLYDALRTQAWMWVDAASEDGSLVGRRPTDLWYVPKLTTQNWYQFTHLNPVPPRLCKAVDEAAAGQSLESLGLRRCLLGEDESPSSSGDPALLSALAEALEAGRVRSENRNYLIGQVRVAWRLFEPDPDGALPSKVVALRGGQLRAVALGEEELFLPVGGTGLGLERELSVLCIEARPAELLLPGLLERFPGKVHPLSVLRLDVEVAGAPWTPDETAPRLVESSLARLAALVLAVRAFRSQGGGLATESFRKAVAAMRTLRVEAVEGLAVRLTRDGVPGPSEVREAHLDPGDPRQGRPPTLLYDTAVPRPYEAMVRPFELLLDRPDLRSDLLVVLGRLDQTRPPDRTAALETLRPLDIDEGALSDVERALAGDQAALLRRLRPVARLLGSPEVVTRVDAARGPAELEAALVGLHAQLPAAWLLDKARDCHSDRQMGLSLYERIGQAAELDHWNRALQALGADHQSISTSAELQHEFVKVSRAYRRPLRALARSVAADGSEFKRLDAGLRDAQLDREVGHRRWRLSLQEALEWLLANFDSYLPAGLAKRLSEAPDPEALAALLQASALAVDTSVDPTELHATNHRHCTEVTRRLAQAAVAWGRRQRPVVAGHVDLERWLALVAERLALGRGFLDRFDERKVFSEVVSTLLGVGDAKSSEAMGAYWLALASAESVAELLSALAISAEELAAARRELEAQGEAKRRRKKLKLIAGAEFQIEAENQVELFRHLEGRLQGLPSTLPPLDLSNTAELEVIKPHRSGGRSEGRNGGSGNGEGGDHAPQELKDAIGAAGEWFVFQALKGKFGASADPNWWISSYGSKAFPSQEPRDGAGCDFEVTLPGTGTTLCLEVKSTEGRQESFLLGPTEVALAKDIAQSKDGRSFRIAHVVGVFSTSPRIIMLPNPYDGNERLFGIDEAGVRMRYRWSGATEPEVQS